MKKVWTFFYGSYMNFNVLKEVDLVPSDQHCVYGIVATATHEELKRLCTHARDVLGGIFQRLFWLKRWTVHGGWCFVTSPFQWNPSRLPTTPSTA